MRRYALALLLLPAMNTMAQTASVPTPDFGRIATESDKTLARWATVWKLPAYKAGSAAFIEARFEGSQYMGRGSFTTGSGSNALQYDYVASYELEGGRYAMTTICYMRKAGGTMDMDCTGTSPGDALDRAIAAKQGKGK